MIVQIRCRMCREVFALIDSDDMDVPMTADMFRATDPHIGSPFGVAEGFEHFRCPFGPIDAHAGHNPFMDPATGDLIPDAVLLANFAEWKFTEDIIKCLNSRTSPGLRQAEIDRIWRSQEAEIDECRPETPHPGTSREISPLNIGKKIWYCRSCAMPFDNRTARWRHEKKEHEEKEKA